jgi:hypothetical protein
VILVLKYYLNLAFEANDLPFKPAEIPKRFVMADQPWKNCQYFFTGECPNLSFISKAILIPQFLDSSETKILERICANCETCREEKRRSLRIRRPLKVSIACQESKRTTAGSLLNVSSTGALVEIDNWLDFTVCERITMQIYTSDQASNHIQTHLDKKQSIVKRIIEDKRQIGVMFINDKNVNKLANF